MTAYTRLSAFATLDDSKSSGVRAVIFSASQVHPEVDHVPGVPAGHGGVWVWSVRPTPRSRWRGSGEVVVAAAAAHLPRLFSGLVEGAQVAGGDEGVGVVVAEDPAAPGEGVFV